MAQDFELSQPSESRRPSLGWLLPAIAIVGGVATAALFAERRHRGISRTGRALGERSRRGAVRFGKSVDDAFDGKTVAKTATAAGLSGLAKGLAAGSVSAGMHSAAKTALLKALATYAVNQARSYTERDDAPDLASQAKATLEAAGEQIEDKARTLADQTRDKAADIFDSVREEVRQRQRARSKGQPDDNDQTEGGEAAVLGATLLGLGAAGAYLFDATHGEQRRADLRQRLSSVSDAIKTSAQRASDRVAVASHRAKKTATHKAIDLETRVRDTIDELLPDATAAIEIEVAEDRVTLVCDLPDTTMGKLTDAVGKIDGVAGVTVRRMHAES
ncbi:MAG: hypothetical protein AAGK78_00025 [Planctomycetota bacterium]